MFNRKQEIPEIPLELDMSPSLPDPATASINSAIRAVHEAYLLDLTDERKRLADEIAERQLRLNDLDLAIATIERSLDAHYAEPAALPEPSPRLSGNAGTEL